jgi:anti-sigma factor RsiW
MECGKYQEQVSLMIDGELNASLMEALSAHMEGCADCRRFHERLRAVDDTLRKVRPDAYPPTLAARVKERLSRRRNQRVQSDFAVWVRVPVMAMMVLLALGLGNMAGRSISELFSNGQMAASIELIAPDSGSSFSDVLLDLGTEENQQ